MTSVLTPGLRLRSVCCETEVVVVRAPLEPIALECGGAPMAPLQAEVPTQALAAGCDGGTQVGKRYAHDELGLELLCTKAGAGSLTLGGRPLDLKGAKSLPSSD
jgi:hypothetical protein